MDSTEFVGVFKHQTVNWGACRLVSVLPGQLGEGRMGGSGFYLQPTGLQTGFLKELGMGRSMENRV